MENAQYTRTECLEISGIRTTVEYIQQFGSKVLSIFEKIGCNVAKENIEDYHRVGKHKNVIVKFSKRKEYQQVFSFKKDLPKLDMKGIDLPEGTWLFVNHSLCSYYKLLWSKTKKLQSLGRIHSYSISNGKIKLKVQENSDPLVVTHCSDFENFFPGVDLSPAN